jgi:two-component system sensor histidine kinase KdpD
MVNEAVDMARIESGKFQVRRRPLTLVDLVEVSLNRMASLMDGTPTRVHLADNLAAISADPDLASLALRQLIGNALKYSPPGSGIEIAAAETSGMITITVTDKGPGIPSAELEAIFERYYRGAKVQHTVAGTGMGLSIARDIVAAHGGRMWADNKPGGGAQFSFTMPMARSESRP